MKKLVAMLVGTVGLMHWSGALAQDIEAKCYDNKTMLELVEKLDLITLASGDAGNGKTQEVLLSKKRHIYVVEFEMAKDGNAMAAKEYCIKNVIDGVTMNDKAVEFLNNLLEKAKGQKV